MKRAALIICSVLLADQLLKFWIKLNLQLGEEIQLADWFIIHFTENPGMAFGLELGGSYGKLFLSLFRMVAVVGIFFWLRSLVRQKAGGLSVASVALILAGALGNIIDSAFYGVIFSESLGAVATLFPEGGGYGSFLHGRVVDMFYFPLYKGYLPDWLPIWGGDYFIFFRPIFNLADASISVGVALMLLFQRKTLS
ncbi:MAG: Lipoprotein signal peptidase [Flavobacteriia bacterium]|nr:MAG: Lipoprotein signal peptidase [Flavobacteriia bacterium]